MDNANHQRHDRILINAKARPPTAYLIFIESIKWGKAKKDGD